VENGYHFGKLNVGEKSLVIHQDQAFNQMGVQLSCGWPLSKENCFIFHMLPYKLPILDSHFSNLAKA